MLCPDLEGGNEGAWVVDELETCAFAFLGEMKVVSIIGVDRASKIVSWN